MAGGPSGPWGSAVASSERGDMAILWGSRGSCRNVGSVVWYYAGEHSRSGVGARWCALLRRTVFCLRVGHPNCYVAPALVLA